MAIAMIMPLIRLRLRCARRLRISLRDFGGSGGSAPRIGSDPCSTQCVLSSKNSLKSSVITDTSLLPGTVECRLQNHHCDCWSTTGLCLFEALWARTADDAH